MTTSTSQLRSAAEEWNAVREEKEEASARENWRRKSVTNYWRNENILLGNLHNDRVCSAGYETASRWNASAFMPHIVLVSPDQNQKIILKSVIQCNRKECKHWFYVHRDNFANNCKT